MDRFAGRCRLEWWANSSLALADIEADVVVTADGDEWSATGLLHLDEGEQVEGFDLLCELDPLFTLRFPGDAVIDVQVSRTADPLRVTFAIAG